MFHLCLVTPEKTVFEDDIVSMIVPGTYGIFEVLQNHAPIISSLNAGRMVITDKDKNKTLWAISGGICEVSHNQAIILADAVEKASEIDVKRAEADKKQAQKYLEENLEGTDIERARKALQRAKNRLKVAQEYASNKHAV